MAVESIRVLKQYAQTKDVIKKMAEEKEKERKEYKSDSDVEKYVTSKFI